MDDPHPGAHLPLSPDLSLISVVLNQSCSQISFQTCSPLREENASHHCSPQHCQCYTTSLVSLGNTFIMQINNLLHLFLQIFPYFCWSRDYLLYPNYNYVSWSYASALAAVVCSYASAGALIQERNIADDRQDKNLSLLYQLYPDLDPEGPGTFQRYSMTTSGSFL